MSLLRIENLTVSYNHKTNALTALDSFSCEAAAGQAIGLIGESGSGKTTLAMAILNILGQEAKIQAGTIFFQQQDLRQLSNSEMRKIRGKQIALIPQASQNAWNPVLTIGYQLVEHIEQHLNLNRKAAVSKAANALSTVGLSPSVLDAFPHQLSGGMRQRAAIALACAAEPALIIADECTNSLDICSQDAVLTLLNTIRQISRTAMIIISHDLTVIAKTCTFLYVLYQGKTLEKGPTAQIIRHPRHHYTQKLIFAAKSLYDNLPKNSGEKEQQCDAACTFN